MELYWMIAVVSVGLVAFISGWLASKKIGQSKVANAERMAESIIKDAEKSTETLKKEKLLEVKDEWLKRKQNFENETRNRRNDIQKAEKQLANREMNMDRKVDLLTKKEKDLNHFEQKVKEKDVKLIRQGEELQKIINSSRTSSVKFYLVWL